VLAGLSRGDRVIVNPNDDMREGTKVQATLTKANLDRRERFAPAIVTTIQDERQQRENAARTQRGAAIEAAVQNQ
jgi:hypothetical protein